MSVKLKIDRPHADVARLVNQAEHHHLLINGKKMELSTYSISGVQSNHIKRVDKSLHCSRFSMIVFTLFWKSLERFLKVWYVWWNENAVFYLRSGPENRFLVLLKMVVWDSLPHQGVEGSCSHHCMPTSMIGSTCQVASCSSFVMARKELLGSAEEIECLTDI